MFAVWGPNGSYVGSGRALELCKIAIGFISTKLQVKIIIPGPVWSHFPLWDFWTLHEAVPWTLHGQDRRTWDQNMRQYLGPENEAVPGTLHGPSMAPVWALHGP